MGCSHECAIRAEGSLWCSGQNDLGQLGLGHDEPRIGLQRLGDGVDWAGVSVERDRSFAIKTDGSLWSWGSGLRNMLGFSLPDDQDFALSPVRIGGRNDWDQVSSYDLSCATTTSGELWCWGRPSDDSQEIIPEPTRVGAGSDWTAIAAGLWHRCGIKRDGTLWCWGENTAGQLGDGFGWQDRPAPVQ